MGYRAFRSYVINGTQASVRGEGAEASFSLPLSKQCIVGRRERLHYPGGRGPFVLNGNAPALKVVVVGGSLGGLFNAIALRSLGCEVDVYEKSSGLMQDRGAGIVFQPEVAEFLTRYDVATLESLVVPVQTRRYLHVDGSIAQESAMPQAMTSWDALYRELRAAFGEDRYHVGVRLAEFDVNGRHSDGTV